MVTSFAGPSAILLLETSEPIFGVAPLVEVPPSFEYHRLKRASATLKAIMDETNVAFQKMMGAR